MLTSWTLGAALPPAQPAQPMIALCWDDGSAFGSAASALLAALDAARLLLRLLPS